MTTTTDTEVDLKAVKQCADFGTLLTHYGIEHTGRGAQRSALCPFHTETKPSLKINLDRKIWNCFGCKRSGNVLDFVATKEGVPLPKAAKLIAEICNFTLPVKDTATPSAQPALRDKPAPEKVDHPDHTKPVSDEPVADPSRHNKPLGFNLRLDPNHPYLDTRGITPDERKAFDIGHCRSDRSVMRNRICFALHNEAGELIGYVGRWPGEDVPADEGIWKLPPGFNKQAMLYNLHRVLGSKYVVAVEGVWSVIRLKRLDIPAVALLGRVVTDAHIRLLKHAGIRAVVVMMDGDGPGRNATATIIPFLARHLWVRLAEVPDGMQPDGLHDELVRSLVTSS